MLGTCGHLIREWDHIPGQTYDRRKLQFETADELTHANGSENERERFRRFLYMNDALALTATAKPEETHKHVSSKRQTRDTVIRTGTNLWRRHIGAHFPER